MTTLPNDALRNYYKSIAASLSAKKDAATATPHKGDRGTNNEAILRDFLITHLPHRLRVDLGGEIFGLNNQFSGQIDVIVSGDCGIRFLQNERPCVQTENAAMAILMKSSLDKAGLIDCLDIIAGIPNSNKLAIRPRHTTGEEIDLFINSFPMLEIFAWDALTMETILGHLADYYKNNSAPMNRRPSHITVNGKYEIVLAKCSDLRTVDGSVIICGSYHGCKLDNEYIGLPLARMLSNATRYVGWMSAIMLDDDQYIKMAYNLP